MRSFLTSLLLAARLMYAPPQSGDGARPRTTAGGWRTVAAMIRGGIEAWPGEARGLFVGVGCGVVWVDLVSDTCQVRQGARGKGKRRSTHVCEGSESLQSTPAIVGRPLGISTVIDGGASGCGRVPTKQPVPTHEPAFSKGRRTKPRAAPRGVLVEEPLGAHKNKKCAAADSLHFCRRPWPQPPPIHNPQAPVQQGRVCAIFLGGQYWRCGGFVWWQLEKAKRSDLFDAGDPGRFSCPCVLVCVPTAADRRPRPEN